MLGWFRGLSHFIHLYFFHSFVTINEPITASIFMGSSGEVGEEPYFTLDARVS